MSLQATFIDWDGTNLPPALHALPPGRYVVAPVNDATVLIAEEDAAVRLGLDELAAGELVPLARVIEELETRFRGT